MMYRIFVFRLDLDSWSDETVHYSWYDHDGRWKHVVRVSIFLDQISCEFSPILSSLIHKLLMKGRND